MPSDRILIRCKKNNLFISKLNARRNFWWNKVLPLTFRYFVRSSLNCYVTAMIGSKVEVDRLLVLKALSMCWACHYQTNFYVTALIRNIVSWLISIVDHFFSRAMMRSKTQKIFRSNREMNPRPQHFASILKTVLTLHWPQKLTRKVFLALLEATCR